MSDQKYIKERQRQSKLSTATGAVLTVSVHITLVACCFVTGFTYLDPPPPEQEQILIEFEEFEPVVPEQIWNGTQTKVAEPDPTEPIKLVQASEASDACTSLIGSVGSGSATFVCVPFHICSGTTGSNSSNSIRICSCSGGGGSRYVNPVTKQHATRVICTDTVSTAPVAVESFDCLCLSFMYFWSDMICC